jgi:hypothetical protein
MNVLSRTTVSTMRLETKYLRLRTPVMLGSRFGDWKVCWLGGWTNSLRRATSRQELAR